MFDIGWPELLVVACVAIIVVGPKDLPRMLRTFGKTIGNLKRMAGDFQRQFDDALREAELDELKKDVSSSASFAPLEDARKSMEEFQRNVKAEIEGKKKVTSNPEDAAQVPQKGTATKTKAKAAPKPKTAPASRKTAAKPRSAPSKKKSTKSSA